VFEPTSAAALFKIEHLLREGRWAASVGGLFLRQSRMLM
jgi:hypothetical protein